jgi:hypothetical protein
MSIASTLFTTPTLSITSTPSTKSTLFLPHVNLAGHGGGDQGGAVLLQTLDCFFNFNHHAVNLGCLAVEEGRDCALFRYRRNRHLHPSNNARAEV